MLSERAFGTSDVALEAAFAPYFDRDEMNLVSPQMKV